MKKLVSRSSSIQDLKCFKWSKLLNEWRKQAPILLRVLRTVTGNSTTTRESPKPFICAAGAILLKGTEESEDVNGAASGWPLPLSWPYKKEG